MSRRMANPPFVTDVAFGSAAQRQDVERTPCPREPWVCCRARARESSRQVESLKGAWALVLVSNAAVAGVQAGPVHLGGG